jgi:hypothetical protein
MTYKQGHTYILPRIGQGSLTVKVEEIGDKEVILKVVTNDRGMIPDPEEDNYITGPAENFQGWMTFNNAKEINENRTHQTR